MHFDAGVYNSPGSFHASVFSRMPVTGNRVSEKTSHRKLGFREALRLGNSLSSSALTFYLAFSLAVGRHVVV